MPRRQGVADDAYAPIFYAPAVAEYYADQTLVDFYYLDRMLPPGGIMVVDDVNMTVDDCAKISHTVELAGEA